MKEMTAFGKEAMPIIEREHNLIHAGKMFTAQVANAALGAGALLYIEVIVPENVEMHLKTVTFYNGADGHYEFIDTPTLTTGVAAVTSKNRKPRSGKTPNVMLKSNPTGISGGDVLEEMFFKATNQFPGIPLTTGFEWELGEGLYLLRLTNSGVGAEQALLKINWYEENE